MLTIPTRCDALTLVQLDSIASSQNLSRTWGITQAFDEDIAREHKRTQFKADVFAS